MAAQHGPDEQSDFHHPYDDHSDADNNAVCPTRWICDVRDKSCLCTLVNTNRRGTWSFRAAERACKLEPAALTVHARRTKPSGKLHYLC